MRKLISSWVLSLALVLGVGLNSAPAFVGCAQDATKGKDAAGAQPSKLTQPALPETEKVKAVADKAAALVTEFDVNGLKVLVKRRAGSLTVATALFMRGGARNITAPGGVTDPTGLEGLVALGQTGPIDSPNVLVQTRHGLQQLDALRG